MVICCSRGRAEDFTTSSCFSLSEIHKENVSNADPNWSQWSLISSRVLTLKEKYKSYNKVKFTLKILHAQWPKQNLWFTGSACVDLLCYILINVFQTCYILNWNPSHSLLSPASIFSTCSFSERACCKRRFLFFGPSWISVALFSKVFMCDTSASHCFSNT